MDKNLIGISVTGTCFVEQGLITVYSQEENNYTSAHASLNSL